MGHDNDGATLLLAQFLQQPADALPAYRIEAAGRFVGKNDRRIGDQGPGNGHALLFAAAKGVGAMAAAFGKTESSKQIVQLAVARSLCVRRPKAAARYCPRP